MCKNERYTREIQRLREECAELKELYATYRERCDEMSVLLNEYPTGISHIDNHNTIAYNDNGYIDKDVKRR